MSKNINPSTYSSVNNKNALPPAPAPKPAGLPTANNDPQLKSPPKLEISLKSPSLMVSSTTKAAGLKFQKMSSSSQNDQFLRTKLNASEFDKGFVAGNVSTFPSLSSTMSQALPTLTKLPMKQTTSIKPTFPTAPGRPIMYARTASYPARPYIYRYPAYTQLPPRRNTTPSRPTKLGFYSPIKISSLPRMYRPAQPMRYVPVSRNRAYPYSMRYMAVPVMPAANTKQKPKRASRAKRPNSAQPPKPSEGRGQKRARSKRSEYDSEDDLRGDDDYSLPQRVIRRTEAPDLVMPPPSPETAEKPLTADELKALENKFVEKQISDLNDVLRREKERAAAEKKRLADERNAEKDEGSDGGNNFGAGDNFCDAENGDNPGETDSWAPCDICGIFNSPIADLIVLCDGCGVAVHKLCYGIRRIPEGDWFCQPCEAQKKPAEASGADKSKIDLNSEESVAVKTPILKENKAEKLTHRFACRFCPIVSEYPRAFKKAEDGEWAHLCCAIYYPEMRFRNKSRFEGFSTSCLDIRRAQLVCQICKSNAGYALQCSAKSCPHSFHPLCARLAGIPLYFALADDEQLEPKAWCADHSANATANARPPTLAPAFRPAAVSTRQSANSDWYFTERLHFFPKNSGYRTEERHALFDQAPDAPGDRNAWTVVSTTDLRSREAFEAHRLIASQWDEAIVGGLEPVLERRMSRKAVGYSALLDPAAEALAAAHWNFWEVNAEILCLCIKFLAVKRFSSHHVSTRRKRLGSLLAAHLVDLALSRRRVQWVLVCSEGGYPELFWQSLGFEEIPRRERALFSVVSEAELNPFRDTVLMRLTRPALWESVGYSLTAKVFKEWSAKHKGDVLTVSVLCGGAVVKRESLPRY